MQTNYNAKEKENNTNANRSEYMSNILEGEEKVKNAISDLEKKVKKGQEQFKELASTVDKQLHENPWPIVGGVAAACLLFGFILGSRRNG